MNFNKMLLLLQVTTYSIILIATTYATTTEAARQRQAEVNLSQQQQQQVAPSPRPLKYGDKTTIKIPLKIETTPTPRNRNNGSSIATRERQQQTRNRPQSRTERISALPHQNPEKPQLSRRYDTGGGGSSKNQLIVQQHDIPIVHKNRELFNKPITPTVGQQHEPQHQQIQQHSQPQQQRRPENLNRSRFSNAIVPIQQPTQQYLTNDQSATTIARTATTTRHNSRQRKPAATTTGRTIASTINNHQPPTSSSSSSSSSRNLYNSNHNHANNSSIVSHQQQRGIVVNKSNSQPLLNVAAAASAAAGGGRQSNTASSSNKQRSNLNVNQSVRSASRSNTRKSSASTALSTTTSSTTTTTTSRPQFQLPNFNIFTPEFWQFLIPTTSPAPVTTTRKPPKKYKPAAPISTKEEKLIYSKPKTTTIQPRQPEPIVNNTPKRDDGPFRIALPTFNILSQRRDTGDESEKGKRNVEDENLRNRFNCPRESEVRFQLFPKICKIDEDCKVWNRDEICCEIFGAKSCVSGIPKPLEETSHSPILGVIPRKCPDRPLAELWWEVKECETDMDCWPRVCCPDGRRRYCRTSQPELNTVPVPVKRSFNYLTEYLECTAPPPPIFDLHPKVCTSTLDCFPNVCCQEAGLRHCRPPKKSVLTMLANVFNVDFVKRLTQNIVIK